VTLCTADDGLSAEPTLKFSANCVHDAVQPGEDRVPKVQPRRSVLVPRYTGSQVDGRHTGLLQSFDFAQLPDGELPVVATGRVHIGRHVRTPRLSAAGAPQGFGAGPSHHRRGRLRWQRGILALRARERVRGGRLKGGVDVSHHQRNGRARILVAKRFQFTDRLLHCYRPSP